MTNKASRAGDEGYSGHRGVDRLALQAFDAGTGAGGGVGHWSRQMRNSTGQTGGRAGPETG